MQTRSPYISTFVREDVVDHHQRNSFHLNPSISEWSMSSVVETILMTNFEIG